jgi:hypothetical protein
LRFISEGRVVQHLEDMKSRQPQVKASCVFKPPRPPVFSLRR